MAPLSDLAHYVPMEDVWGVDRRVFTYPRLSSTITARMTEGMKPPPWAKDYTTIMAEMPWPMVRGANNKLHLALFDSGFNTGHKSHGLHKFGRITTYPVVVRNVVNDLDIHVLPRWYWRPACGGGMRVKRASDLVGTGVHPRRWLFPTDHDDDICGGCMRIQRRGLERGSSRFWLAPRAWHHEEHKVCDTCDNLGVITDTRHGLTPTYKDPWEHCPDCLGRPIKELIFHKNKGTPTVHIRQFDPFREEYTRVCQPPVGRQPTYGSMSRSRAGLFVPRDAAVTCNTCLKHPYGKGLQTPVRCPKCRDELVLKGDMIGRFKAVPPTLCTTCDCGVEPKMPKHYVYGGNLHDAIASVTC